MKFKGAADNPGGMGTVETLLVLIIVAIVGFTGWYIYNSNKKTNKIYNAANQAVSAQTSHPKSKPKPQVATAPKTFTFKEYKVTITLSDSLKDLSYNARDIKNPDGTTSTDLFLDYPSLAKAIDDCNTTKGSEGNFAALNKSSGKYPSDQPPAMVGSLLKQFDSFYVSVSYPNGNYCGDSSKESAVSSQAQALQKALVDAFKTAQLV